MCSVDIRYRALKIPKKKVHEPYSLKFRRFSPPLSEALSNGEIEKYKRNEIPPEKNSEMNIEDIIEAKDCTTVWLQDLEHGLLQKMEVGTQLMKIVWTADTSATVKSVLQQQVN